MKKVVIIALVVVKVVFFLFFGSSTTLIDNFHSSNFLSERHLGGYRFNAVKIRNFPSRLSVGDKINLISPLKYEFNGQKLRYLQNFTALSLQKKREFD